MGAIRGTSQTKLYNEFGLESLKFRRRMRRLCIFYKIKTLKAIVNLSSYEKKVTLFLHKNTHYTIPCEKSYFLLSTRFLFPSITSNLVLL